MTHRIPRVLTIEPAENLYIESGNSVYVLTVSEKGMLLSRQGVPSHTHIAAVVILGNQASVILSQASVPVEHRLESAADVAAILHDASSHVSSRPARVLATVARDLEERIATSA